MLEGLKPYPAMKDSGVPWLGKVPKHWEVGTLRRKLRPYDGIKIGPFGSQLKLDQMSASGFKVYGQANVIAGDFARGTKFVDKQKFDELSACEVRSHDLVVTMMGTSGRCACVPETAAPGIMDSHLLRLRVDASIDVSFAALVIDQGPYVKEQISVAGKGSIMQGLNSGMVKDLVLALPPLPEQAAIVRFLDHADRRIRRYIRAKQKLIKLLEEQKQAIIHRAVTRGLDPTNSPGANLNADQQAGGPKSEGRESPSSVRLKPSGVEWLGDVPEHWSLKRFKFLARVTSGQVDPRKPEHRGKTLVAPNHIKSGTGKITDHETADEQGADSGKYEVRQGQIIYSKIRPNLRKAAIASVDCLCSADMYPIAVRETELRPAYLLLLLLSAPFTKYAVDCSLRVAMPKVDREALGECWFWYPSLEEQDAILQFVEHASEPGDLAVDQAHREINLLREYRTRLIADVVTGKLDVREAAAQLPDEAEELEPLDEANALTNGEGEGVDDLDAVPEEAEA